MLATPSGVSAAAGLVFSCRCAVPGYQTSRSNYTRGQSRETGSLSRLSGSLETTAKCVSIGPAYCKNKTYYLFNNKIPNYIILLLLEIATI